MRTYQLDRVGSQYWGTLGILYEHMPNGDLDFVSVTLEPEQFDIPVGTYTCEIYTAGAHPYHVFQVMNVPGHSYIEIHIGNWASDTKGCILLGLWFGFIGKNLGISGSKMAFENFMRNQGEESFRLEVV
jgi:hypothetical protein